MTDPLALEPAAVVFAEPQLAVRALQAAILAEHGRTVIRALAGYEVRQVSGIYFVRGVAMSTDNYRQSGADMVGVIRSLLTRCHDASLAGLAGPVFELIQRFRRINTAPSAATVIGHYCVRCPSPSGLVGQKRMASNAALFSGFGGLFARNVNDGSVILSRGHGVSLFGKPIEEGFFDGVNHRHVLHHAGDF